MRELKRLMEVVRNGDRQQKLNVDKLTSDFKLLVNLYSELQIVCMYFGTRIQFLMLYTITGGGKQNEVTLVAECFAV